MPTCGFYCLADHLGAHWVDSFETQLLHLNPYAVQTKAVGDRGVDIECFAGNSAALLRLERPQCPKVVQSVGELNQNNADVFGHGHRHLLEVFSLLFFFAFEVNVRELRHTIHEIGHYIPELSGQRGFRYTGVFNNVV